MQTYIQINFLHKYPVGNKEGAHPNHSMPKLTMTISTVVITSVRHTYEDEQFVNMKWQEAREQSVPAPLDRANQYYLW